MYRLRRPTQQAISLHLAALKEADLSYSQVGATIENEMPHGWAVNHAKVALGVGDNVWSVAQSALREFTMFNVDWVDLVPEAATMAEGEIVATMARICGIWTVNACRIVKVVDEPNRYGFAYGTLSVHAMRGEERFLLLRDPDTGEIVFDITSFSKPRDIVSTLTLPMVRSIQRRFVRESCQKLAEAVSERLTSQ